MAILYPSLSRNINNRNVQKAVHNVMFSGECMQFDKPNSPNRQYYVFEPL